PVFCRLHPPPTRRSSDLTAVPFPTAVIRIVIPVPGGLTAAVSVHGNRERPDPEYGGPALSARQDARHVAPQAHHRARVALQLTGDRKSTRLNSSHVKSSY